MKTFPHQIQVFVFIYEFWFKIIKKYISCNFIA